MRHQWIRTAVTAACIATTGAGPAAAQSFPAKPVRIITAEPGGGNDVAARIIAAHLAGPLGQPVVIENRGGASGVIAAEYVIRSAPDGYTLMLYSSAIWIMQFLRTVSFDALRDFAPITLAASAPNILVVHPSLPVKSVKDLIALAKARPGQLNYATGGSGAAAHLSAELFKSMARIDMVRVIYKGTGPGVTALIGGEVQVMFPAAGAVAHYLQSGRLRALGVTSTRPSVLAPGVPTIAASGLPGFDAASTYGIFAPARTPDAVVRRLYQEFVRVLAIPEVKEQFLKAGMETVGSSPEEFAAAMKLEMTRMGKVIKDAGIGETQ
jgi:tripartite-type tricarboxylate transporter receptor subunit TctC